MDFSTIFTMIFTVTILGGIIYTFYGLHQIKKLQNEIQDTLKQTKKILHD